MVHRLPITKARINLGQVVKRVHVNKEYFILEKDGIPVAGIGIFILPMVSNPARTLVLFFIIFPSTLWACIALGFQRGTIGPNRFGPDLVAHQAKPNSAAASL